jgi:N6-L-threonylcarbamoyladenine synthase
MTILGIETSCDETAAAVWLNERLGSNIIASQAVHKEFGGVVPELASRAHVQLILPIVRSALKEANIEKEDLDGIAVTYGPGLAGSLLVGLNFAKAMSLALKVPFIGINHMEGHLFSNSVLTKGPEPPFMCLIISGGHTQLVLVKNWGDYEILGKTRDDAAGEAFDKVAKMLELEYPGGPAIDKLAKTGNADYVKFPRAKFKDNDLDFSYSGLKTAVLYHLHALTSEERTRHKADVAASFQVAAVEVLIDKSLKALEMCGLNQLALAGGVACNSWLRKRLQTESEKTGFRLFIPPAILCTDNGAMIARAGKFYLENGVRSDFSLSPKPSLAL